MKNGRRALLGLAVAAGAIASLLVAAEVSGTSPQQVIASAVGSISQSVNHRRPSGCCAIGHPCYIGTGQSAQPSYGRGCYWAHPQPVRSPTWRTPCGFDCAYPCSNYCPPAPPCTGVYPMKSTPIPAG